MMPGGGKSGLTDDDTVGSPRYWMLVFALMAISIYAFIDRVVLASYGWPDDISDTEILELLLARNLELVASEAGEPAGRREP